MRTAAKMVMLIISMKISPLCFSGNSFVLQEVQIFTFTSRLISRVEIYRIYLPINERVCLLGAALTRHTRQPVQIRILKNLSVNRERPRDEAGSHVPYVPLCLKHHFNIWCLFNV